MDRRKLLANTAALGLMLPATQILRAYDALAESAPTKPSVFDLEAETPLPEMYESVLTAEEKAKVLRDCAGRRMACFPILEGELVKTQRKFQSYSLFLISNPGWLGPDGSTKIAALYNAYEGFSRSIGNDHAAVFFWTKQPKKNEGKLIGSDLAANIDAARCAKYEKAMNLNVSSSPHVLVTTKRPSPDAPMSESILLQLNGLSPATTERFLTKLADQLVGDKLDQEKLDSERWWLTWRDVITKVYAGFSDLAGRSKVTIKGGPVEFEIDGKK